jgi:hypothetical protein
MGTAAIVNLTSVSCSQIFAFWKHIHGCRKRHAPTYSETPICSYSYGTAPGLLDTRCFQKATNKYLYLPFTTETPLHILSGFITGEIIRYIKRCSAVDDYVQMLTVFHARLRLRGYPMAFLGPVFGAAPSYDKRDALLTPSPPADQARSHCLILSFSRAFERLQIARALHEHVHLLPLHLQEIKIIVAWRLPRKLGGLLATFRYPRLTLPSIQHKVGLLIAPLASGNISPT